MSCARFAFRWYGTEDAVTLADIRQIPCVTDIVSACYEVPSGERIPRGNVLRRAEEIRANGLTFSVAEGLPVHESIKLGTAQREAYLDLYCENIETLAACGIRVICYNFMPVFGWIRTQLHHRLPDGSQTLSFSFDELKDIDPCAGDFSLPGWHFSTDAAQRKSMIAAYRAMGSEGLRENLRVFLKRVVPVAQRCGVRLAIHPDDPPVPVFGLPRVVSTAEDLRFLRRAEPSPANGITLCAGSFASAGRREDPAALAREFAPYIPFVHARNVRATEEGFVETGHCTGSGDIDMAGLLRALMDGGFDGYIRADHGRMIFGETGAPGYGLFDRALGISYLSGIWEGLRAR